MPLIPLALGNLAAENRFALCRQERLYSHVRGGGFISTNKIQGRTQCVTSVKKDLFNVKRDRLCAERGASELPGLVSPRSAMLAFVKLGAKETYYEAKETWGVRSCPALVRQELHVITLPQPSQPPHRPLPRTLSTS